MLIGLNGVKGAGKDTVGSYLVENYGFERLSFAALLKESAGALFDVPAEQWDIWKNDPNIKVEIFREKQETLGLGDRFVERNREPIATLTAREFLQRYGTESHRDTFGYEFWVTMLFENIPGGMVPYKNYCITDARFENELRAVRANGGVNWRIDRETGSIDTHASEASPPEFLLDQFIWNHGTLEDLYHQVDLLMALYGIERNDDLVGTSGVAQVA